MKINFASIYFKSIAIVLMSCGILATFVSFLGDRASREIAAGGVQRLARVESAVISEQLYGPLRFRKIEDVAEIVDSAMRAIDMLQFVLVFDLDGTLLTQVGYPGSDAAALAELARSVIRSGTPSISQDGLTVAYPVRKEKDDGSSGAVVSNWTTAPLEMTLTKYRRQQLSGAGLALVLLALVAGIATRRLVSAPVDRIRQRAEAMALNDLDSATPGRMTGAKSGSWRKRWNRCAARCALPRKTVKQPCSDPRVSWPIRLRPL